MDVEGVCHVGRGIAGPGRAIPAANNPLFRPSQGQGSGVPRVVVLVVLVSGKKIADGRKERRIVRLDNAHLASGALSYSRENERVDVTLTATEPNGRLVKEQVSFLGKAPSKKETAADPEAERAEKLQKDLNLEAAKTRKLEKDLKQSHEQLQRLRRRLEM